MLVLGRSGGITNAGQIREELPDLGFGHIARMPFFMKENESFNPLDINLFGSNGIMAQTNCITHLVEQFGFADRVGDRYTGGA